MNCVTKMDTKELRWNMECKKISWNNNSSCAQWSKMRNYVNVKGCKRFVSALKAHQDTNTARKEEEKKRLWHIFWSYGMYTVIGSKFVPVLGNKPRPLFFVFEKSSDIAERNCKHRESHLQERGDATATSHLRFDWWSNSMWQWRMSVMNDWDWMTVEHNFCMWMGRYGFYEDYVDFVWVVC